MKLTSILILAACLQASAAAKAQKISLDEKSAPLARIFNEIKAQTGYVFWYEDKLLAGAARVSIHVTGADLRQVLDSCFAGQPLTYDIIDKTIVVKYLAPSPQAVADTLPGLQVTVKGHVQNEKGEPLEGASITVKNSAIGTHTDAAGNFTLGVSSQSVLVISNVGYETRELPVKNTAVMNITLKISYNTGEQMVVIGYGSAKRKELTTSVSSVGSETIGKLNVARIEQALQGNAPGVMVLNSTGQPGDKPMIRIRGTGTNGSPDPLFIVDGFPVSSIQYINPGDIDRIDILKDAASAAIYGARGANGVVLITTKSGKRGTRTVSYDGYYGLQNAWRRMPVMNAEQYAATQNESYANANPTGTAFPYANPASLGKGTDWEDAVFTKNAPVVSHQVTVSGGNDNATYLASFSYFGQQGIIGGPKSWFERYTARLNTDQKVTDFLRVGANINYIFSQNRGVSTNAEYGGILSNAANIDPITPLYQSDPAILAGYNANAVKNGSQVYGISPLSLFANPAAQLSILNNNNRNDKLLANAYAELTLYKGLKFRSTYGIDLNNNSTNSLTPPYYLLPTSGQTNSTVTAGFSRSYTWQTENTLTYSRSFGKHSIEALAGQSAYKYNYQDLSGTRTDPSVIDPNMGYLDVATIISPSNGNAGGADKRTLSSLFGRLAYNYDGRYFVSAVLRRDGSSRFGPNNPYANFPSASAAWIISKESFFTSKIVSLLKIRGSWGQNGNENLGSNSFPWAARINNNLQGYTFLQNGVEYIATGATLGAVPNPNLRWETNEQTDIGADAEFWNGRLAITTDYYVRTTKDLLITPDNLAIIGFPPAPVNGGNVQNKGFELGINYRGKINKDAGFSLSFNMSRNINKVTQIPNLAQAISGSGLLNQVSITRMAVGQPIGFFWGQQVAGIFQSQAEVNAYTWTNPVTGATNLIQPKAGPGDLKFADNNNDGKISDLDRQNIGDPNPAWTGGFTVNANYKNFDISIFTIGMFGNKIYNGIHRFDLAQSNFPAAWLDHWTTANTGAKFPRIISTDPNFNNSTVSTLFVESGSFARVKNIQLGYTVPAAIISKIRLTGLRCYIAVDNAFTFTRYSGFDPEIGATSPLSLGIDRGIYPQARTLRMGVSVKL